VLGLITGSGFYDVPEIVDREAKTITTPYGDVEVTTGRWAGEHEVAFIARHGSDHSVPPHAINYRANIRALSEAGVTAIIATAVSGGIAPGLDLGHLVVIDDFLNFSSGRASTFFDEPGVVQHTDMTNAYDVNLRATLVAAGADLGIDLVDGGTYCTFDGPRFESPAEIRMAGILGADLVGMTGYPEVVLAAELGIPYASIGVISNKAAGLADADLSIPEIMAVLETASLPLYKLIGGAIGRVASRTTAPEELP